MTWNLWILAGAALALSFANGANDNFKGVATLFGSGTASYRRSLGWATVTTAAGSLTALLLASALVARFSGRGLVPDAVTADPTFLAAVGGGAAATVFLASRCGLPISTTHALTGALVGAGLLAAGDQLRLSALGTAFVAPLLLSPVLAAISTSGAYALFRTARARFSSETNCVCLMDVPLAGRLATVRPDGPMAPLSATMKVPIVAPVSHCAEEGLAAVTTTRALLDVAHYASAGAVGFARGINDTPKLLALLIPIQIVSPGQGAALIAAVMAIGGLLGARRVAETISHRVTTMNAEQGFAANVTTAILVLFASRFGLPVSTTHVSSGSLFGLGAVTRQARWDTIVHIALAWVVTLPCAAVLAALLWWIGA
jgi:inorganic phosphate transporter, PiT family